MARAGLGGAFDIASADGIPETLRMVAIVDQATEKRLVVGDASRDLILKVADELWKQ